MTTIVTVHTAEPATYSDKVVALFDILHRYQRNTDRVSLKLLDTGTLALSEARRNLGAPTDVQDEIVERHMRALTSHVVCPIFSSPNYPVLAADPRIERGMFWNARAHRECYVLFGGRSPIDRDEMAQDPTPHFFAREIVQLNGSYEPFEGEEGVVSQNPAAIQERRAMYINLITGTVLRAGLTDWRFAMSVAHTDIVQTLAQIRVTNGVVLEQAQEAATAHTLVVRRETDALVADNEARLRECRSQLALMDSTISGLQAQLTGMNASNSTIANLLREKITAAQASQTAERTLLTNKIAAIEVEQRQAEAQRLRDVAQRAAENQLHMRQIEGLTERTVDLEGRVNAVSLEAAQNQEALLFEKRVSDGLRTELGDARETIEALRQRMRNKGGSCAIL